MRPDCHTSRAIRIVSMCEMWFTARMTPPSAGIFSRPRQRILNSSASSGYSRATQNRIQNPAFGWCSRDTFSP